LPAQFSAWRIALFALAAPRREALFLELIGCDVACSGCWQHCAARLGGNVKFLLQ